MVPTNPEPDPVGIGFADLAGFTALTEQHGDDDAAGLAERFCDAARETLVGSAQLVKAIGDAVMLRADSIDDLADSVQSLVSVMSRQLHAPDIRAGLHRGPVAVRRDDVFGSTVNVAARVTSAARPGQILCTREVVAALGPRNRASARLLGAWQLRNIAREIDIYELGDQAPTGLALDPVCRMRVPARAPSLRLTTDLGDAWFCSLRCLREHVGPQLS